MQKIVLKALVIMVMVGLITVWKVNYTYNHFVPAGQFEANQKNLEYYQESYSESHSAFLRKTNELKKKYPRLQKLRYQVPSKIDDSLFVDVCYIPSGDSSKLFILSSGIHGVEGFVGSAMQLYLMDQYLEEMIQQKTGVLILHAVNPYGFKYLRRATENNVDLNRNSDVDQALFDTKNPGYARVNGLINPTGPCKTDGLSNRYFFLTSTWHILKTGINTLRQAILKGQYTFPRGVYYGGKEFEPQITWVNSLLDTICPAYNTIVAIDLHTGYGERGKMHLFPNPVDRKTRSLIEELYEGIQIDWGDQEDFYTSTGSFVDFIGKIDTQKSFIPMVFEFGTMNSQKTMGSIKSLQNTILENQGRQYGFAGMDDSLRVMGDFREQFFPSDPGWRSECLEAFKSGMEMILPRFYDMNGTSNASLPVLETGE